MYLHIGNGKSVIKEKIIVIFDLDTSTVSKIGKDFINKMQKKGLVEYEDSDLPRSFVLVEEDEGYKVRLSRISSGGLKIRCESTLIGEEI